MKEVCLMGAALILALAILSSTSEVGPIEILDTPTNTWQTYEEPNQ